MDASNAPRQLARVTKLCYDGTRVRTVCLFGKHGLQLGQHSRAQLSHRPPVPCGLQLSESLTPVTLGNRTSMLVLLLAYTLAAGLVARPLTARSHASAVRAAGPASTESATASPTPTCTPTPTATPTATATATLTPVPLPVHVLRSYPIDGDSDVLAQAPLRFLFDQPMDAAPGALTVVITPSLPLEVEWPAPDSLLLRAPAWQPNTVYRVTLQAARGATGGTLARPVTLTFGHGGKGAPIPILMYHHVDVFAPSIPPAAKEWAVHPDDFVAQMDLLAEVGAHMVPLAETVDYLAEGAPLPERPVVLTFDDGNKHLLQTVIPVIRARRLPAIFFVPANYADVNTAQFMNWADLKALAEAGLALGGHSYNHSFAHNLSAAEAGRQIGDERRRFEVMTGVRPVFFAYPFGRYSPKTIDQLKAEGYRAAVTIEQNVYQKPSRLFELGRIRVGYGEPVEALRRKLPWRDS